MTYCRVIPRDLFNEADLLKCLGKLWIAFEGDARLTFEHDGGTFEIWQDSSSGAISVDNVTVWRADGRRVHLWRPLNARGPFPLYAQIVDDDDNEVRVFDDLGAISGEFRALIDGNGV